MFRNISEILTNLKKIVDILACTAYSFLVCLHL